MLYSHCFFSKFGCTNVLGKCDESKANIPVTDLIYDLNPVVG